MTSPLATTNAFADDTLHDAVLDAEVMTVEGTGASCRCPPRTDRHRRRDRMGGHRRRRSGERRADAARVRGVRRRIRSGDLGVRPAATGGGPGTALRRRPGPCARRRVPSLRRSDRGHRRAGVRRHGGDLGSDGTVVPSWPPAPERPVPCPHARCRRRAPAVLGDDRRAADRRRRAHVPSWALGWRWPSRSCRCASPRSSSSWTSTRSPAASMLVPRARSSGSRHSGS